MTTNVHLMYPAANGVMPPIQLAGGPASYYAPVAVDAPVATARTASVSVDRVRELLDAAGPLSLRDIAGGLNVAVRDAATVVRWMLDRGWLVHDEWERHRLSGPCRAAA